jgi:hypothetical protein
MVPVYLLNELAHWPLWASFLLVGGLMLVVGAVLTYLAKKEIDTINPLQEESAQALKENVEWITKPK